MCNTGFDNQLYIEKQSAEIQKRINDLGGKLYLEFGGKLFDDFHASRVLPGFAPDSKIQMLKALSDKAEILIAINAGDIVKNKIRGDLGITYDQDVLRLIDAFRGFGLFVSTVVITCYSGQPSVEAFQNKLEKLGLNRKEANEFIVYWLPLMEQNPYNIISFQTDIYTDAAELQIDPAPDTVIRVFMTFEASDYMIRILPQKLTAPERIGFTVVEWGGTEVQ